MCLIAISFKQNEAFPLVIASNRDEYFKRPTRPINWWPENPQILAGKDLYKNGTWLGFNRNGKFAAITNYREGVNDNADQLLSRGEITSEYLQCGLSPESYLLELSARSSQYRGFNLFLGNKNELYYFSNIENVVRRMAPGLYCCSNGVLGCSWPKVTKIKKAVENSIYSNKIDVPKLYESLRDDQVADGKDLPDTGVGKSLELAYSAVFVKINGYGTRNSTIASYSSENKVKVSSREFSDSYKCISTSSFQYDLLDEC